jgi:hypothetical protein
LDAHGERGRLRRADESDDNVFALFVRENQNPICRVPELSGIKILRQISGVISENPISLLPELLDPNFWVNPNAQRDSSESRQHDGVVTVVVEISGRASP